MNSPQYDQAKPQQQGLDSEATILARKKLFHDKDDHRAKIYDLRLIAANYLDIGLKEGYARPSKSDGRFGDVEAFTFEDARYNPITVNTKIQTKSLAFMAPDLAWQQVRPGVNAVRKAWYLHLFKEQYFGTMYRLMLLDAITGGQGDIDAGFRDGSPYLEWADGLDVSWDTAHNREPHRRRCRFRNKHMPLGEALGMYPKLKDSFPYSDDAAKEREVTIVCYHSKTTTAVLYQNKFIDGPRANPYGRIPGVSLIDWVMPSIKFPMSSVEDQLGPVGQAFRYQRHFREVANRGGTTVGVLSGSLTQGSVDDILDAEEGTVVQLGPRGDFKWAAPAEFSKSALEHYRMLLQDLNALTGINDFQQSRTDVNVDFASQLSFMAAQSGVQAKYMAQEFESAVKDSVQLLMDIGARFGWEGELNIGDTKQQFGPTRPINVLLGGDGEIIFKPGGMEYKAPMQKLQEAALFGNVLSMASTLPAGLQIPFVDLVAKRFEIDDPDAWTAAAQEAQARQEEAEMQAQMMQAQAAQAGMPQQTTSPKQGQSQGTRAA